MTRTYKDSKDRMDRMQRNQRQSMQGVNHYYTPAAQTLTQEFDDMDRSALAELGWSEAAIATFTTRLSKGQ